MKFEKLKPYFSTRSQKRFVKEIQGCVSFFRDFFFFFEDSTRRAGKIVPFFNSCHKYLEIINDENVTICY